MEYKISMPKNIPPEFPKAHCDVTAKTTCHMRLVGIFERSESSVGKPGDSALCVELTVDE